MDASSPNFLGPVLPTDLEREIFEFSALSNPRSIHKLLLVARRVKIWIEPLLYRNLSVVRNSFRCDGAVDLIRISTDNCLKLLDVKPAILDHVRNLALTNVPGSDIGRILSGCRRVESLALFQTDPEPSWLPFITAMPLRQLSANVDPLFGRPGVDLGHSLFAQLTHLDFFETPVSDDWVTGVCRLPCLTHLSFTFEAPGDIATVPFPQILASCTSLKVLIVFFSSEHDRERFDQWQYFCDDPRSVTMVVDDFLEDWERGATGALAGDYWIKAERFIQKRRSGEIKGAEYSVPWDPIWPILSDSRSTTGSPNA
ncbi:hypothetical protein MVEN_01845500 [Mycena venus]|uniref:Uncharacterized protein n=1 Tax=Mycena venus TaxID=2733690 RepID=A0A8H7CMV5_9AGAR|nr:hypothetical protein MVEN_01845500 [Mycena venus]